MIERLILFLLLMASIHAVGQDGKQIPVADPAAVRDRISETARLMTSIKCEFVQLKHLDFLEEDVESSGLFYFRNDNRLRWEYLKPYPYVIVIAGDQISILDDGKLNVYEAAQNPVFSGISKVLSGIVSGSLFNDKDFRTAYFENGGDFLLVLEPLSQAMKGFLRQIELDIDGKDLGVKGVKLVELSGDYTRINFIKKKINAEIADPVFDIH